MRKTLCLAGFASALLFVSTGFTQQPMPPIAVPYSQALPTQPRPLPAPPVVASPAAPHAAPLHGLPAPAPRRPEASSVPPALGVPAPLPALVSECAREGSRPSA